MRKAATLPRKYRLPLTDETNSGACAGDTVAVRSLHSVPR
jgi:hypothetical protein